MIKVLFGRDSLSPCWSFLLLSLTSFHPAGEESWSSYKNSINVQIMKKLNNFLNLVLIILVMLWTNVFCLVDVFFIYKSTYQQLLTTLTGWNILLFLRGSYVGCRSDWLVELTNCRILNPRLALELYIQGVAKSHMFILCFVSLCFMNRYTNSIKENYLMNWKIKIIYFTL